MKLVIKNLKKSFEKVLTDSTKYAIMNELFREGRQRKNLYIEK